MEDDPEIDIESILVEQSARDKAECFVSSDEYLNALSEKARADLVESVAALITSQEIEVMMLPVGGVRGGYIDLTFPGGELKYIVAAACRIEGGVDSAVGLFNQEQFERLG